MNRLDFEAHPEKRLLRCLRLSRILTSDRASECPHDEAVPHSMCFARLLCINSLFERIDTRRSVTTAVYTEVFDVDVGVYYLEIRAIVLADFAASLGDVRRLIFVGDAVHTYMALGTRSS
jgi:hypothetical protein